MLAIASRGVVLSVPNLLKLKVLQPLQLQVCHSAKLFVFHANLL